MVSFVKILLTGATGFVGGRLASHFARSDAISLVCAVRRAGTSVCGEEFVIGELNATTEWTEALIGQDVVIHAAARVHIVQDETEDPLGEYRKINVRGTLNLARQAARAGVRRFIFISSIKVNGEHSPRGFPFTADAAPAPEDAYGISKLEAEEALSAVATETGMEVVIIRPPLVYGPGVKGNFATLIELLEKGVPLPLGAIHNKRSLVALDNLVDLIVTCIDHPKAGNQVFLAGDGEDVSTTELLRGIGNAIGRPARLIPVPAAVLMFGAGLLGKKAVAQRVLGSLQVDISKTRRMLGWEPPLSLEEGLRRCFDSERSC